MLCLYYIKVYCSFIVSHIHLSCQEIIKDNISDSKFQHIVMSFEAKKRHVYKE